MRKILIALLLLSQIPLANAYVECTATSTNNTALANLSSTIAPEIIINEISFKDKTADFIELYIKDDKNNGLGTSIKDFSILVDGTEIKKIATDILIKTGGFILITFKSSTPDETTTTNNILKLYTSRDGLVSTTSVVSLKKPDATFADAVCWDDGTPTETQQSKIAEILSAGAWTNACVSSTNIKDNESIARNFSSADTNQASDWNVFSHSTPASLNEIKNNPPIAKITVQEGSATGTAPLSINVSAEESSDPDNDALTYSWNFGDNTTSNSINPPSHSYTTAGTYTISLTVTDSLGMQSSDSLVINATAAQEPPTQTPPQTQAQTSQIVINEFMPDPEGTDTNNEWIELKNLSDSQINIAGYKLDDADGGSSPYVFPDTVLSPQETKAFYNNITKITLNNDTDRVRLFDPTNKLIDEILYEKPISGQSFSRNDSGQWSITSTPTPNAPNIFSGNENPQVTCNKISSANLVVSNTNNKNAVIKTGVEITSDETQEYVDEITITEILPNPSGKDNGNEWLEIYNESDKKINLGNWKIQTADGKKKQILKDKTFIAAGAYLAITTKISLKNSGDKIQLIDPEGNIIDEIQYPESRDGMSYAKIISNENAAWEWTKNISRGAPNPIYETFNAKIVNADKNNFTVLKDDKQITVAYSEEILPQALAANVLQAGENFSIKTMEKAPGVYELQQIEPTADQTLQNSKTDANNKQYPIILYLVIAICLSVAVAIAAIFYIKKHHN